MTYRLIVFDMDGTLTEELLDFDAIRRDIGLPENGPILELISQMTAAEQARAHAILHEHEMAAAEASLLHPGVPEMLARLEETGIAAALLTRNSAACAATILRRHRLRFKHVATREDRPYKPHPDSILNITRRLGFSPRESLMVGDYRYDLEAAAAAGVDSVLACQKYRGQRPAFASQATYCIDSFAELLELLER